MDNIIHIELLLSSHTLNLKDVSQFMVGMEIQNTSSQKIGFDISKTELWVNGEKNLAWDLAVQNGTLVNLRIPALSSEKIKWPLGDALFTTPGNYELNLRWGKIIKYKKVTVLDG